MVTLYESKVQKTLAGHCKGTKNENPMSIKVIIATVGLQSHEENALNKGRGMYVDDSRV